MKINPLTAAILATLNTSFVFAAPPSSSDTRMLEEVIVSVQRTDEGLSKTPVAVTVLTSDAMAKAQIVSEQDLRSTVPGLSVRAGVNSNQLNYSLRGQSQDPFSNTRPGVLPYINEVQIGGAGGATAFYDLQSVQVLKGPQGTLFGRSATGGAVLFTTAAPTEQFSGYVSGLAGDYNAAKVEGAVSGPIIEDKLLGRLAGFYHKRDGFQDNVTTGGSEGDIDRFGGRLSLSIKPSDNIQNDLMVDYYHTDDESMLGVLSGLLPFTGTPGQPPFIPMEYLYAGTATPIATATGIATLQALTGGVAPLANATAFYNGYFADPKHPSGGIRTFLADQKDRGPYKVSLDAPNYNRAKNVIITNTTAIDINDNTQIKNIIGYTHLETLAGYDADGTPFGNSQSVTTDVAPGVDITTTQMSEELQLAGEELDGRLTYVTGVYLADEKTPNRQASQFFDLLFGGFVQHNDFEITSRTYSGYGQGTYALNDDGLSVSAGIRYTSEKVGKKVLSTDTFRAGTTAATGNPDAPDGYDYDQSEIYNKVSWQFGIQDQITEDLLLYATTRRGHKSGGFNGTVPPKVGFAGTAGDSYDAEQVTDLELGAKFQGRVGNMPARLSMALYHNWLVDSQRTAYTLAGSSPATLTVNVPEGKIYGAEIEGLINPTQMLTLGATLAYTHAAYGSKPVNANGSTQVFDQVPDTPKFSGTVYADLTIPVTDALATLFHVDVYGQQETFTTPRSENSEGTTIRGYVLTNFRIGIEDLDKTWSVTANLKNAFDKVYYVGGIPTGEIYQVNTLIPGDPRTWTLEGRMKF